MSRRHLVVGNPDNRRVELFAAALERRGHPRPIVLAHADLVADPDRLDRVADEPLWVRIDSAGEDGAVERQLLRLGFEDVPALSPAWIAQHPIRHGEVLHPRQHHAGWLRYLEALHVRFARRPEWRILQPPRRIAELFDKRACAQRYARAGVPVAPRLEVERSGLDDAMSVRGWRSVFVKLTCGSSASGLAVYRRGGPLMTTLRRTRDGWFNSLRVQRIDRRERIDEVLGFLFEHGSVVERALPKARFDGAFCDLRFLVVAGEPAFTVVRKSTHPITNLHLGGERGDLDAFVRAAPPGAIAAAQKSCRAVARLHGCLHLGIDVLFSPGLREHVVLESNAFGDLLPNLERDGLDVYEWEIEATAAG